MRPLGMIRRHKGPSGIIFPLGGATWAARSPLTPFEPSDAPKLERASERSAHVFVKLCHKRWVAPVPRHFLGTPSAVRCRGGNAQCDRP